MDWKCLYKLHSDIIVHPRYGAPICYHLVPAALSGSCTLCVYLCVNCTRLEAAMVSEGWFGGKFLRARLTRK